MFQPGKVVQAELGGIASGAVQTIVYLPKGSILIGGWFDQAGGATRHNLARLLTNGVADPGFNPGLGPQSTNPQEVQVKALLPMPDGSCYVGGAFTSFDAVTKSGSTPVR
jgi:hypothetical protein